MPPLKPTLTAVNQNVNSLLFRLPLELRHQIYEFVLTPTHLHVERLVDFELDPEGIRITETQAAGKPTPMPQTTHPGSNVTASQEPEMELDGQHAEYQDGDEDGDSGNSDQHRSSQSEEFDETEINTGPWDCSRIYSPSESSTFLQIAEEDGDLTPQQALRKLFRIYFCRSQRLGGSSAVPPGYLDHRDCRHDAEQIEFEGSTIMGLKISCQWAYNEINSIAASKISPPSCNPWDSWPGTKLELASHTLHFSDTKDLACFTGLIPRETSEAIHRLSLHVPSFYNPYWPYVCNIYLQPWSRISILDWMHSPSDHFSKITFYHNHTTHDLADPTISGDEEWKLWGENVGRREIAEALASTWVVPNIQVGGWSTKFRMAKLNRRAGGPLDLRLSFPLFLRRDVRRCEYGDLCSPAPVHRSDEDDERGDWFDSRRWLDERFDEMPIAELEHYRTMVPRFCDHSFDDDNDEDGADGKCHHVVDPEPGKPGTVSDMEHNLCFATWEMNKLIMKKMWLEEYKDSGNKSWSRRMNIYDRAFHDIFLQKRRDVPRREELLGRVHDKMQELDECQGLENLEIDFFGDVQSPGMVSEVKTIGTTVLRDGLVERFTGRNWRSHAGLEDPVSVFWDIGPHPEPNFQGWADPNGNMVGMRMNDAERY